MGIISNTLEKMLLAFTALGSVHAVFSSDLLQLSAVAGITVLCALTGIAAVAAVAAVAGLRALAARALAADTGGGCNTNDLSGVCAATGAIAARFDDDGDVGGRDQLAAEVFVLTFDLSAAIVLCAQGFDYA